MQDLSKALLHIRKDKIIAKLISRYTNQLEVFSSEDVFVDIVDSIVSQQLSVKAAATIFSRVKQLVGKITPENILKVEDQKLRDCGLSWAKVKYIKDLATKVSDGTLQLERLGDMTDQEVIDHLVQVKGIGQWSAEMILMFTLNRPDVFPLDDLGIQNAFVKLYGLNRSHKSLKKKMTKIAQSWIPYRTLACRYLWKSLDNKPLEK